MKGFCTLLSVVLLVLQNGYAQRMQRAIIEPDAESNGVRIEFGIKPDVAQITGVLGLALPASVGLSTDCGSSDPNEVACHQWGDFASLVIASDVADPACVAVQWASSYARRLEDCFDIVPGTHWYGGGEMYRQYFPIEGEPRVELAVVTADSIAQPDNMFGGITESYWMLSSGVSIHVDENIPLFFSVNTTHANRVCFVAKDEFPYKKRNELQLKYTLCGGENIVDVRKYFTKFYSIPSGIPDEEMLVKPFFSTWAQYKEAINQSLVLQYAKEVQENGFTWSSHIEIDDDWETCYGELEFNPQKFPDPKAMVEELKAMNFRTTLWIHPFINFGCPSHATAVNRLYFVSDPKLKPQNTFWWQGLNCGIVDMANPAAVLWWRARLQKLVTDYGIDAFKFDAGETNWLPYSSLILGDITLQPNLYSTRYVEAVSAFGGLIEVRAARRNQDKAIFFRMLDRDSRWGYDNGLKTLIPTLLHFGIVGYPFVLPDMVGGNVNGNDRLNKELFIRWVQANIFMPAIQFSVVPWRIDQETVDISLQVLSIRQQYQDKILAAARQATVDGSPINRPMFWVDPTDPNTFPIDDQYMLGDDILVAPVLEEGAVARDIYLPAGRWQDGQQSSTVHTGPTWLRGYSAPLSIIPYFIKQM